MQPVLRLLGRFETVSASGSALNISGARAQLLLARLALAQGGALDRSTLSTMLWGERADAQARASLRQLIWTIRQALKLVPDALVAEGDLIRLNPVAVGTDVALFDRLALSPDPGDLEAALAVYRGDLLEGIDLISLAPDGYFLHERSRLRDLALKVVATLVDGYDRDMKWEQTIRASRRGLAIDPYDEALHGRLVGALQKLGRNREARDQGEAFRKRLKAELGIISPPQATMATDRRSATAQVLTMPASSPDPMPSLQNRPTRMVIGLALAVTVFIAVSLGIWRQSSDNSAALPTPIAPAAAVSDRIPTRNLAAYDQYLRAEAQRRAATDVAALRKVLPAFRRAFTLDPNFAEAHAGYAFVAVALWERSLWDLIPSITARNGAYDAAGRALELDPDNARALIVLSRIQAQDGAGDQALATARRAVTAEPDSAEAHANLALILSRNSQAFKARAELTRLRQLDPIPRPEWLLIFGEVAFAEGRYYNAIADLVAAWPELPDNPLLLEHLTAALAIQGQLVQAQMVRDKLLTLLPEANLYLLLEHYSPLRRAEQNQRLLDGLRRAGLPVWPQGVGLAEADRLTGTDLAALLGAVPGSRDQYLRGQYLRGNELCRIEQGRSVCGAIYRAPPGRDVDYVFVAPTELRFFSVPPK